MILQGPAFLRWCVKKKTDLLVFDSVATDWTQNNDMVWECRLPSLTVLNILERLQETSQWSMIKVEITRYGKEIGKGKILVRTLLKALTDHNAKDFYINHLIISACQKSTVEGPAEIFAADSDTPIASLAPSAAPSQSPVEQVTEC